MSWQVSDFTIFSIFCSSLLHGPSVHVNSIVKDWDLSSHIQLLQSRLTQGFYYFIRGEQRENNFCSELSEGSL